jgi:hypothetical protein
MIVLCRGAGMFDSTAWGANSIRKNVGMPLIRAEMACEWLEKEKFISNNADINKVDNISLNAPSLENKAAQDRKHNFKKRWNISKDKDKLIYLPNTLIDGTPKSSTAPIQNLYNDIIVNYAEGQDINDARLDALMLLIHLYSEHSLEAYGGVNPNVWHRLWNPNDSMMEGVSKKDIDGSSASLYEIQRGDFVVGDKFISSTLFYAAEAQRKQRLLWAFNNLEKGGLFYEVLGVWNSDPISNSSANVCYPLYLFDARVRSSGEPFLAWEINGLANDIYTNIGLDGMYDVDGQSTIKGSGNFRYVGYKKNKFTALSNLRLRYRANSDDTGLGILKQRKMVEFWTKEIKNMRDCL